MKSASLPQHDRGENQGSASLSDLLKVLQAVSGSHIQGQGHQIKLFQPLNFDPIPTYNLQPGS